MNGASPIRRFVTITFAICVTLSAQIASACPTCKDSLTENYIAAYGYSIMFMMSMPFIIFGSLVAYFYYEVRKARRAQPLPTNDPEPSRDQWSRSAT